MEITSLSSLPLKSRLFFFWASGSMKSYVSQVTQSAITWIWRVPWLMRLSVNPPLHWATLRETGEQKEKKGGCAAQLFKQRADPRPSRCEWRVSKHAASNLLSRRRNTSRAQNFYLQLSFCSKCNRRSRDPETLNAVWKAGQIEAIYPPDM